MFTDKKIIVIIVLAILCVVFGYLAFRPINSPYDEKFIQKRLDSLDSQNKVLQNDFIKEREINSSFKKRYDSLGQIPPKIEIKYVYIDKKVDKAGSHAITNGFDSIFSNNGIR